MYFVDVDIYLYNAGRLGIVYRADRYGRDDVFVRPLVGMVSGVYKFRPECQVLSVIRSRRVVAHFSTADRAKRFETHRRRTNAATTTKTVKLFSARYAQAAAARGPLPTEKRDRRRNKYFKCV